ncbi:MAG: bifunctional pyr operon transcriptional regulator/uracil phosphoribosyltransferase PyrR [bacterium]|nr:bifunctional pyr operon transcriptional regulator/uracil phosphoribosyltransferase PyrR [bacterium]
MPWIEKREIMDAATIDRTLNRMVHEIIEKNPDLYNLAIVGIRTRGIYLAERLQKKLAEIAKINIPLGTLDITMYRDDLSRLGYHPVVGETHLPFVLDDKQILLVDDVLYTGRTIRAALDALMDYGRPASIQLAVLIDRGHRELPIAADFVGRTIPTAKQEQVQVKLIETDTIDQVVITEQQ